MLERQGYPAARFRDEVPEGPLTIICGSGYRSTIASSLLHRARYQHVTNVIGGMGDWVAARYPVTL